MVGSFYELYDVQYKATGETECNVREIVEYLGIQLSTKKNEGDDSYDILFAGFPDYVMHKWAGRLTSAGWTVVVVDQIKDQRGKVKERKVSRILSPSTHIENTSSYETPYIITMYFNQLLNQPPTFGAAALDLTTGTTHTYSGLANGRPDIWTVDDLVQMTSLFQPKEVLVYWNSQSYNAPDETYFKRIFGFNSAAIHIRPVESSNAFSKELVRKEYLQKTYSIKSLLPPKTYLGLRSEQEELALLYLLVFIEEHYPSMLKSFHRNEPWMPQARLICGNHALTQLQMIGNNPAESVLSIFNSCISPMGKRAMKERLLSPYSDSNEIKGRLEEVKEYLSWDAIKKTNLEKQYRYMYDLPRLHRKLLCGLITSAEIGNLFQTYSAIQVIANNIVNNTRLQCPYTQEQWSNYMTIFEKHFDDVKSKSQSDDVSPFNVTTYKDIGEVEKNITSTLREFEHLKSEIATRGKVNEETIRLETREKEPFGMKCSTVTIQALKKNSKDMPDGIKFTELKSGGWIDCKKLQQLNTQLLQLRENLINLIRKHIVVACHEISEEGYKLWTLMENWVCHLDCTQCIGRVSLERGFTCPTINEVDESGSGFDIKGIRHPLVESSATRIKYVNHDISLGWNNSKGWLVYGMNASGKSTLMKATGLCILLAQAGCFVPAKEMSLKPFQAVYTRILNHDNLFAGLSSFAVEMSELRDILRNANKYTLVLGDELCAGTESISAQALVASGIQWLSKHNSKFIFATHLHDLPEILDISQLGVEVWHLHVDYDPITKKLVYDRTLRRGSGSTLYGLEVARAMDLPFDFIEQALINRHKITGSKRVDEAISSNWNRDIVRKECEICKSQITDKLEVHHIRERSQAVNGILQDGTHMNNSSNLIVICQKCHDKVHNNEIDIGDMKVTSNGMERTISNTVNTKSEEMWTDVSSNSDSSDKSPQTTAKNKKSKWSDEELKIITDTLKKYTSLSLKSVRHHLDSTHSIEISEAMLGKIKRGF